MVRPRARCQGFSLIEAAIVLGIVGLVIGGIWVAAAAVTERNRQSRFLEEILQVSTNLQKSLKGRPPFDSDNIFFEHSASPLANQITRSGWGNIFPADMIDANSNWPLNPWGGQVYVVVQGSNFSITTNLPPAACLALMPRLAQAIKLMVDTSTMGTSQQDLIVNNDDDNMPVGTPETATINCVTGLITPVTEGPGRKRGMTEIFTTIKR